MPQTLYLAGREFNSDAVYYAVIKDSTNNISIFVSFVILDCKV